jgi:hypothetical protein
MPRGVKGSGPPRKRAPIKPKANKPQDAHKAPAVFASADKPLGSVDIDSLSGDELKAYARRAGVYHEDVENLTEDRLRQNTKLVITNHFELIEELG